MMRRAPDEIKTKCNKWLSLLPNFADLYFTRCLLPDLDHHSLEIHGLFDASEGAFTNFYICVFVYKGWIIVRFFIWNE